MSSIVTKSRAVQKILMFLLKKPSYGSKITREVKVSYSYIPRTMRILEQEGIIHKEIKDGRTKIINLTEKGRKIAEKLEELEGMLK